MAIALLFLHQHNPPIFHRDIKPANALLTAEGSRDVAKLADFGLHVVSWGAGDGGGAGLLVVLGGLLVVVLSCWWWC
jgi:hypothetical protein